MIRKIWEKNIGGKRNRSGGEEHLRFKKFGPWNWYPFKHKLTISLKVVKVGRFVSFASRSVVTESREEPRMGKLATYVRPRVFPPLPESPERFQRFLGFRSSRTFCHSTHAWTLVGVHTLWISPRRANRACVFFRVLSCLLVSTSEIFSTFYTLSADDFSTRWIARLYL